MTDFNCTAAEVTDLSKFQDKCFIVHFLTTEILMADDQKFTFSVSQVD